MTGKYALDIGCGTGIATRQLHTRGAKVTGSDIAKEMIREAKGLEDGIEYVVASTSRLPFVDHQFDLITAFSAFHWFCDNESITEIKRVLKKDGVCGIVNKNDVRGIRKDIIPFFEAYSLPASGKSVYDPEQSLREHGFMGISSCTMRTEETFTAQEAVEYLQSIALWNLVPEEKKEDLLLEIEAWCIDSYQKDGELKRHISTTLVTGRNP